MINKNDVVAWIREYFAENGPNAKAVIGISGGKDSTIAAALCVEALGADRVIGVRMPQGTQKDIQDAYDVCDILGIASYEINIGETCKDLYKQLDINLIDPSNPIIQTNTPARIRMTTLYAVAAAVNGRVCCTSNRSEAFVGYSTKWGDNIGDFAPLRGLTVTEVYQLGVQLNLPGRLVAKDPADGMSGKTDEENLGFSYYDVDNFINGKYEKISDGLLFTKILKRYHESRHKRSKIPCYIKRSN